MRMRLTTLLGSLALAGGVMLAAACAEETTAPPPPDNNNVCTSDLCANNSGLQQKCTNFMNACVAGSVNPDECYVGGAAICSGT